MTHNLPYFIVGNMATLSTCDPQITMGNLVKSVNQQTTRAVEEPEAHPSFTPTFKFAYGTIMSVETLYLNAELSQLANKKRDMLRIAC